MTGKIGESVRRADGEDKVRGRAIYGMDHAETNMIHARLLRSPVAAGRIVVLDITRAMSIPGVRAIITAADIPCRAGVIVKDQCLMALEYVRYAGEPIAAVAAGTEAQALAAVAAIDLEIEAWDPVLDPTTALAPNARVVHPDWASYDLGADPPVGTRGGNVAWESRLERGDVSAAFADAHLVVQDEFTVPRQHQSPIEPHCAVASITGGRYVVHTPTQAPFLVRDRIAEFLGLRASQIRVVVPTIGGGFGGKVEATLEPICALLAQRTGRPVRIANSRREELATTAPREGAMVRLRSAVGPDGDLLAQEAECLLDAGAYAGETVVIASVALLYLGATYRIPGVRHVARAVYTNTPPTGGYRGLCGPYCVFAMEQHLDHIARELELDRLELRLRNALRAGERMANGQEIDDDGMVDAIQQVRRLNAWPASGRTPQAPGDRRPMRGTGLAATRCPTHPEPTQATVKLNEDGTVGIISAAVEIGTGAVAMGARQIAAAELGVQPSDVMMLPPDTDAAGYDGGSTGSGTTFALGNAVRDAAEGVREQLFETAAEMLEVAAEDLRLADGHVVVVGSPDSRVALADVATTALWTTGPIASAGRYCPPPIVFDEACVTGTLISTMWAVSSSVHLAEVEVDEGTGKVTITRYVVTQDVGRIINARAIEGQIHGGVLQGIGYALLEELRIDDFGLPLDASLERYRLPTALDAPRIEITVLEHPCPYGPYGAKGVGEPPIVPVAAAIAAAVADAIGQPVRRLPITPFSVLETLRSARPA